MRRVLLGALVGGLLLFAWTFAGWMFLGIHKLDVEPVLANEEAVVQALAGTERGVYWIPGGSQDAKPDSDEYKAWEEKHKKGPRGFLVFNPEGADPMSTTVMGIGLLVQFLVALIVALILYSASIRSFVGRFLVVLGIGVVVALIMDVQMWNWQDYPDDWTRGALIDHLGGMGLLGIVLGAIVRPARKTMN